MAEKEPPATSDLKHCSPTEDDVTKSVMKVDEQPAMQCAENNQDKNTDEERECFVPMDLTRITRNNMLKRLDAHVLALVERNEILRAHAPMGPCVSHDTLRYSRTPLIKEETWPGGSHGKTTCRPPVFVAPPQLTTFPTTPSDGSFAIAVVLQERSRPSRVLIRMSQGETQLLQGRRRDANGELEVSRRAPHTAEVHTVLNNVFNGAECEKLNSEYLGKQFVVVTIKTRLKVRTNASKAGDYFTWVALDKLDGMTLPGSASLWANLRLRFSTDSVGKLQKLRGQHLQALPKVIREWHDRVDRMSTEAKPTSESREQLEAKPAASNPVYNLEVNEEAAKAMIALALVKLRVNDEESESHPEGEDRYLSPKVHPEYLLRLVDAAEARARTRGAKKVTPRDVRDAAAQVAAEGIGKQKPESPAAEEPLHYADLLQELEALRTSAPSKWGRGGVDEAWRPRVLVQGEKKGVIAKMFKRAGCDVATCDLQEADDDQEGIPHFQGDGKYIQDLGWDLVIGHPPCQYLSNAGGMWLNVEEGRRQLAEDAAEVFFQMANAKARFVVIEQPKMHRYARQLLGYPKFQYLNPFDHGTGHTKPTGIMVTRGELPAIKATCPVPGRIPAAASLPPSPYRSELRSQTYLGIAGALATQWVPELWKSATNNDRQNTTTAAEMVRQASLSTEAAPVRQFCERWVDEIIEGVIQGFEKPSDEGDGDRELLTLRDDVSAKPIFFYEPSKPYGYMSQWYHDDEGEKFYDENDQGYDSTEQYMMAQKADVMGDIESRDQILRCEANQTGLIKELGRKVSPFNQSLWDEKREGIVRRGNFLKFSQNKKLKQWLLDTGDRVLAEAAPYDLIWGIGVNVNDAENGADWRGANLLGKVLMAVRELLKHMNQWHQLGKTRKGRDDAEEVQRRINELLERDENSSYAQERRARCQWMINNEVRQQVTEEEESQSHFPDEDDSQSNATPFEPQAVQWKKHRPQVAAVGEAMIAAIGDYDPTTSYSENDDVPTGGVLTALVDVPDRGISRIFPLPNGRPPRSASLPLFSVRRRNGAVLWHTPNAIADTGAGYSVVAQDYLVMLPLDCELEYHEGTSRIAEHLFGVQGQPLCTMGVVTIKFNLGDGYGFQHDFIVISSSSPILILGNDFWARYSPTLAYDNHMRGRMWFDHWPDGDENQLVRGQVPISFTLPSIDVPATIALITQLQSTPKGEDTADAVEPNLDELGQGGSKSGFTPLEIDFGERPTLVEEYLKVGPKSKDVLLFTREAVNIDPWTTTTIWLSVPEELKGYEQPLVVERMPRRQGLEEVVGVAQDITTVNSDGRVKVKLLNLRDQRVSIAGYTPIARLITDQDWFAIDISDKPIEEAGAFDKLPDHLKEAISKAKVNGDDNISADQRSEIWDLIAAYGEVFAPNPKAPRHTQVDEVVLPLKPGAQPHRHQPSRLGEVGRQIVEKQVAELEAHGLIRKSNSAWASRIVLVGKKTGDNVVDSSRLCIDFRQTNSKLETQNSPLPRCDEAIDRLSVGSNGAFDSLFVSTMDLASGFHTLPIREEDKKLTAFCTHRNQYEWNYLPFGINCGPSYMVRLMDAALGGLAWEVCAPFLDDVAIYSHGKGDTFEERHESSFQEHKRRLRLVLERLIWAGLSAKASKCHFANTSCDYLGHHIDREGLSMEGTKVEVIKAVQPDTFKSIEDIRSFLGLCSYYRKLIPEFSKKAGPLTDLTKTTEGIDVAAACKTPEVQAAIEGLKQAMLTAPVLAMPDFSKQFILKTDAAVNFGLGGVLSQKDNEGRERVIAYFSRKLSGAQRNYSVTEIELLAALECMKHWRTYLWGRPFHLIVDHQALKWLHSMQDATGGGKASRLQRWILSLQEYDFTVEHKPGVEHKDADGLSRLAILPPGEDDPRYEEEDPRVQVLAVTPSTPLTGMGYSQRQPATPEPSGGDEPLWSQRRPPAPPKFRMRNNPSTGCFTHQRYDAIPGTWPWKYEWRDGWEPFGTVEAMKYDKRASTARGNLAKSIGRAATYQPTNHDENEIGFEKLRHFDLGDLGSNSRASMPMPRGPLYSTKRFPQIVNSKILPVEPIRLTARGRQWHDLKVNHGKWVRGETQHDSAVTDDPVLTDDPALIAPVLTAKTQHDKDRKERNAHMNKKVINEKFLGDCQTSYETLLEAQEDDPECRELKRMVTGQSDGSEIFQEESPTNTTEWRRQTWLRKEAAHLYVHEGLLYRVDPVKEQKGGNKDARVPIPTPSTPAELLIAEDSSRSMWIPAPRIYVPQELRVTYLEAYHDRMGHQGATRTYNVLKKRYFWPGMQAQVARYVADCHECTLSKTNQRSHSAPLRATIGTAPFDICVVDVLTMTESRPVEIGGQQFTAKGYTKLLVFVDSLTRWVEAVPLFQDPTTEEIIDKFISEVIVRHGTPRQLRSDLGSNFASDMAKYIAECTGYDLMSSAPEHHETVGVAERIQQTLVQMTRTVDEGGEFWPDHLPHLLFAYRATPHRVTDLSPAELIYGRELRTPAQISEPAVQHGLEPEVTDTQVTQAVKDYTRRLSRRLHAAWEAASFASKAEQEQYVSDEQRTTLYDEFQPGDWVVVKIHGKQNKLKYTWSKPRRIAANLGEGDYVVWDATNKLLSEKQHVSNLKKHTAFIEEIDEDEYLVEKLIGRRRHQGILQYLVKWQGYNVKDYATWEPVTTLAQRCQTLIDDYEKEKPQNVTTAAMEESSALPELPNSILEAASSSDFKAAGAAAEIEKEQEDEHPIVAKFERKQWHYGRRIRMKKGLKMRWYVETSHTPEELESEHFEQLRSAWIASQPAVVAAVVQELAR